MIVCGETQVSEADWLVGDLFNCAFCVLLYTQRLSGRGSVSHSVNQEWPSLLMKIKSALITCDLVLIKIDVALN